MHRSGILHIGLPKTGTTSCQAALHAHRQMLLDRHGYHYPGFSPNHTDALCTMFLDDPRTHISVRVQGITTSAQAEALRAQRWAQVEGDIASVPWTTLVLSAEGLSNLSAPELARMWSWMEGIADDWSVFLWARHPVRYVTSVIQQIAKGGETLDALTQDLPLPNIRTKTQNAQIAFGAHRVRLGVFEEASAQPGGVVAAFCRELGLPEATALEIGRDAPSLNESLSMLATMVLDSLNRQRPMFVNGTFNPRRRRGEVNLLQRIGGPRFRLSPEVENEVRRQSRQDVAWLNETLGTAHYLDVFEDHPLSAGGDRPALAPEAMDSLALLISDLINARPPRPAPSP